jgi:hypothetical protein
MTLFQLLTLVNNRLDDTKEPYLWSDEELTSYANQRINEICEEVPAIRDDSSHDICVIPVVAGKSSCATDPRIIYITEAKLFSEDHSLVRMTFQELRDFNQSWRSVSSTPRHFMTDVELDRIFLYPKPIINDTLYLNVIRYPLEPLNYTLSESMTPEIPARFHELLVPGITALAYLKADAETEDLVRAKNDLSEWMRNVEKIKHFYLNLHYSPVVAVPHKAFM